MRSKGVLEYAAAARRVCANAPQVQFLLVGASDSESADPLTPDELGQVAQSVSCTGRREDVADVLAVTDLFVLPSYYMEGIPRVLLEAAAAGLPMITARTRGCVDVVEDGISGMLVPPRDIDALEVAILDLLSNPVRRCALGGEARRRIEARFDVRVIARELGDLYRDAMSPLSSRA